MAISSLASVTIMHTRRTFHLGILNLSGMDISADLEELGKIPVMVVCAGVKSILDVGRTLEYLVGGY